jgi:hypothetical protein
MRIVVNSLGNICVHLPFFGLQLCQKGLGLNAIVSILVCSLNATKVFWIVPTQKEWLEP